MRNICIAAFLCTSAIASAQAQFEDKLRDLIIGKPLYLRGQWASDKLSFDATGTLHGNTKTVPFTLSGVQIDSLKYASHHISMTGHGYGIEFSQKLPVRTELAVIDKPGQPKPEVITIEIDEPGTGPVLDFLMDKIFLQRVNQFLPQMPDYWRATATKVFPSDTPIAPTTASTTEAEGVMHVGGSVLPPKLLKHPNPEFNAAARALHFTGETIIRLQVGVDGKPTHIRIVRPIGLGLDEQAVQAVSQYVFAPATQNGAPVAVELTVAVNFQIMDQ
jgi:TonB family protein